MEIVIFIVYLISVFFLRRFFSSFFSWYTLIWEFSGARAEFQFSALCSPYKIVVCVTILFAIHSIFPCCSIHSYFISFSEIQISEKKAIPRMTTQQIIWFITLISTCFYMLFVFVNGIVLVLILLQQKKKEMIIITRITFTIYNKVERFSCSSFLIHVCICFHFFRFVNAFSHF